MLSARTKRCKAAATKEKLKGKIWKIENVKPQSTYAKSKVEQTEARGAGFLSFASFKARLNARKVEHATWARGILLKQRQKEKKLHSNDLKRKSECV